MKRYGWILVVAMVFLLAACSKENDKNQTVTIREAWARTALKGDPSAIYFIVENSSDQEDTLLSASTDAAMMTELHMSSMDANGVMKMEPQSSVSIPAGGTVEFKKGGLHVMLMSVSRQLKVGDSVQLTLNFEKAGKITLEVPVKDQ